MNREKQDLLLDLLTKKVVYGLDEAEQRHLDEIHAETEEMEFRSLEITAAAISIAGTSADEPLPAHLYSKIVEEAGRHVGSDDAKTASPWPPVKVQVDPGYDTILSPREIEGAAARSWFGWLGWAAAAAACIVLAINIWFSRAPRIDQAVKTPVEAPNVLTQVQMCDLSNVKPSTQSQQLLTPAQMCETGSITASWTLGNLKEMKQITGDVIWSDEKQAGYVRVAGLAVNDGTKETYQLWIFDKTQDKATPIDGGTFDIISDGETVIPINAKLKVKGPEMFAITIEKPGGVVVSKREKLAAVAKVE